VQGEGMCELLRSLRIHRSFGLVTPAKGRWSQPPKYVAKQTPTEKDFYLCSNRKMSIFPGCISSTFHPLSGDF
jgi:hypothetical protein